MNNLPPAHTGPGLVDLQMNGYAGFDFNGDPSSWTAADLRRIRDALNRRGVVAALPTLISDFPAKMIARARRYSELVEAEEDLAACFPKLHLEGPFISTEDGPRGAHSLQHCQIPERLPGLVDELQNASGGRIGIVTLAPELPGAVELISRCVAAGICVAIGHAQPTPAQVDAAVAAGATMSTHLGNASHQMLPRLDNYVQAQLADDRLAAGFIGDGHHMPFSTLKNFIRAKTVPRSILVTDAIMAAELGPGRYHVGDKIVEVTPAGRASQPGQPNLSGSVLTLDLAVINAATHCGLTFEEAWQMASINPVRMVRIAHPRRVTVEVTPRGFIAKSPSK